MDLVWMILAAVGGYLFGAIPFGLVICKAAGLGDIRAIGSGNIGATNVLRTGRKDLALATLLLDAGKAGLALLAFRALGGPDAGWIAGAAAFLGHCYPVWLKFKGGKGVATFFGAILVGSPMIGAGAAIAWLATAFTFRFSSLGALVAAILAIALGAMFKAGAVAMGAITVMAGLIFWTHRANIARLLRGEEPKIGTKTPAAEPAAGTP
jgi:acyl phosphate:glycerol-3-phosphate acyltransferase